MAVEGWLPPEPPDDLPPTTAGRLADLEAELTWRRKRLGLPPEPVRAPAPRNERPLRPGEPSPPATVWLIWPENMPSVRAWLELASQWRTAGELGVRTGLDYAAAWAHLDRTVEDAAERRRIMDDLRLMEAVALEEIAADLEHDRAERERLEKLNAAARRG